ncbi:hypothetical protein RUM44_003734 [Polyplax serrata]|uniref:Uncharacterized protein n=1 Tax=Polyplax serrata TaxID=468196 RepID=A0ABR1AHA5_POLSC
MPVGMDAMTVGPFKFTRRHGCLNRTNRKSEVESGKMKVGTDRRRRREAKLNGIGEYPGTDEYSRTFSQETSRNGRHGEKLIFD